MRAAVAVDDVDVLDRVEQVLLGVRAVDVGDAGVEAGAEQRHQAALAEPVLVRPLPAVLELGDVGRLVVGGVEVGDPGLEAGVHQRQVLVRQRDVEQQVGALGLEQLDGLRDVVGVDLGDPDVAALQLLDLTLDVRLSDRWQLRCNAYYGISDYQQVDRDDRVKGLSARIEYSISPAVFAALEYGWTQRRVDDASAPPPEYGSALDFDRNQLWLTLGALWGVSGNR